MRYPAVAALVLLSGCISSSSIARVKPGQIDFAREVTRPGALVIATLKDHETTVGLLETRIEGDQLCGAPKAWPNRPPPTETDVCVPTADIFEIGVLSNTENDVGASTVFWGSLATCVVVLPLCFAKGASAPGQ